MTRLTVERLFGNPPIGGTQIGQLKFAPDGGYVAYLRPSPTDRERLDLWRYDLEDHTHACWVDSSTLAAGGAGLSEAEKAERERKRQFGRGITQYAFSPSGDRLLIPLDGAGFFLDTATSRLEPFTPPDTRQTDFRFSPRGGYVSYVRDNDLYCFEIASGRERRITRDGSDTIASGIADFIAQEEMHRFEGHWWAEDDGRIAFTRTDTSRIEVSLRYEIDAEQIRVVEQRYPYAGRRNAAVGLKVYSLADGGLLDVDYRHHEDDYLARVDWAGTHLAVQVQSRDQQLLRLDFHAPEAHTRRTLLEERASTWINLHDQFRHLDAERFLWNSQRSGRAHLYLFEAGEPRALTCGEGRINGIVHADGEAAVVTGWLETPVEQHVYRIALAGGEPEPLTRDPGWHEASADREAKRLLIRHSRLGDPGAVYLLDLAREQRALVSSEKIDAAHPYRPYLAAHCVPTLGTLLAADGQRLHYRLTRPPAQMDGEAFPGKRPLIVMVYGGPGAQRVKDEWPPLTLQLFAQRGYGVLELDNRGSSNRDSRFEGVLHRRLGCAEVADQVQGARFAQTLDWVDAERIGIIGHSYGGFMTLMCLAQAPDLFKAGVATAPVTDWSLYDTHYTERYLATPQDNAEGYRLSSVFPHLDALRGALLVIHGMADDNVLFTHTTRLIRDLQSRNVPFEMMAYPGSKHALQEQDVSVHRFNLILRFFERNL